MNYYRGFKLKVWNRLNDAKGHVAAKLPASSNQLLRWGCIYTEVPKNPFESWGEKWKYKYLEFEIDKDYIIDDLSNDDILVKQEIPFEFEDDLFFFLESK